MCTQVNTQRDDTFQVWNKVYEEMSLLNIFRDSLPDFYCNKRIG